MPYVNTHRFLELQKRSMELEERAIVHYERANWYARRHAMAYGHDEIPLRNAIFEYFRKRDLKLDYHEVSPKIWNWHLCNFG